MKYLALITLTLALSACGKGLEMAKDPTGTDEMRISPCACAEINYEFQGYEWSHG